MNVRKVCGVLGLFAFFGGLGVLLGYASGYPWGTEEFGDCLMIGLLAATCFAIPVIAGDR